MLLRIAGMGASHQILGVRNLSLQPCDDHFCVIYRYIYREKRRSKDVYTYLESPARIPLILVSSLSHLTQYSHFCGHNNKQVISSSFIIVVSDSTLTRMSPPTSTKPTILVLGATGGCVLAFLVRALNAGYNCSARKYPKTT